MKLLLDENLSALHAQTLRELGQAGVIRLRLSRPTEKAISAALRRALIRLGNADLKGRLAVVDETRIRIRGFIE